MCNSLINCSFIVAQYITQHFSKFIKKYAAINQLLLQQSGNGKDRHRLIFTKATELMESIIQSPVPVIAKVKVEKIIIL